MNGIVRVLIAVAAVLLTYVTWFYLSEIIIYLIIAAVISLLGRPVMKFLGTLSFRGHQLPSGLRALLTILSFYFVITGLVSLFAPLIVEQIAVLTDLDYNGILVSLQEPLSRVNAFLHKYGAIPNDSLIEDKLKEGVQSYLNMDHVGDLFGSLFGVIGNIVGLLIGTFAVTFISFYFLADRELLYNSVATLIPTRYETEFNNVVHQAKHMLTRYLVGMLIQFSAICVFVTTLMLILGVENALLIGFFAALMNIVPYVGPILGLVFAIFVAITTNIGVDFYSVLMPLLIKIAVVFGVMQLLDNLFLQPFIFSNSVKAHPLEIFILILVAGTLAGVSGMILAIPIYTILRIVGKEFLSEFKIIQSLSRNI